MNIRDLREARAVAVAAMRAIADKPGGANGDLSAEQRSKFDELKAQLTATEAAIGRQELLDDAERRMAGQPISGSGDRNLDRELESFSLLRAIASQVPGVREQIDCGREIELSAEVAKRSDLTFNGMAIPLSIFRQKVERRDAGPVTSTLPVGGPGGNIIRTDYMAGEYIDLLRAALVVRRAGARVLSNLEGNLDIPKLKSSATAGWVAENAAIPLSEMEFAKVQLTPKHVGALTEFSRNMLLQSSPDVEQLARQDFAQVLASAVDKAAIVGGGSNEPDGILATQGIGDVAIGSTGGAPRWEHILDLIAKIDDANALNGSLAFLGNSKITRKLRSTQRVLDGSDSVMVMDSPSSLAGYPYYSSSNVPSDLTKAPTTDLSALLFGNWADLLLGYWSEFDLLINPYDSTAYPKGNVLVRGFITMDVAVRHADSFAACKDMVTTTGI